MGTTLLARRRSTSLGLDARLLTEQSIATGIFLLYTYPFFGLIRESDRVRSIEAGGAGIERAIQLGLVAVSTCLLLSVWRAFKQTVRIDPFPWLLLGLCVASVLWSHDRSRSAQVVVQVAAAMGFGAYLGLRFTTEELLSVTVAALAIAATASAIAVAFFPDFGIDVAFTAGKARGIYRHKNTLGQFMALAITLCVVALLVLRSRKTLWISTGILAATLLALTGSRTSMAATVLIALVLTYSVIWRRRTHVAVILGGFAMLFIALAALAWSQLATLASHAAGQDTLADRAFMWVILASKIIQHPVIGYGFRAFWNSSSQEYVEVWDVIGWFPTQAHNGFVDVMLDLGVLGLIAVLAWLVATFNKAFNFFGNECDRVTRVWAIAVLTLGLVLNLAETVLVRPNAFWILFVTVSIQLAKRTQAASTLDPSTT